MAVNKFLRIFFGKFNSDSATAYVVIPGAHHDTHFADFLNGVEVGGEGLVHTRVPQSTEGNCDYFDEYIDLHTAKVNPVRPEDVSLYKDMAGIEYVNQWITSSQYLLLPTNSVNIECEGLEWAYPTRRLSIPLETSILPLNVAPNPNGEAVEPAPGNYPWPQLGDANIGIMRLYFRAGKDDGMGGFTFSDPRIVDVPFDSVSPAPFAAFQISNPNVFDAAIVVYRAQLITNTVGQRTVDDFPRLIDGHDPDGGANSQTISANTGMTLYALADLFDDTLSDILDRPALNNARARMNLAYEGRHMLDEADTGLPRQLMLILNTENYKYYKGIVLSLSPMFSTGMGKRTEDTAIFQMQVFEEGFFTEATLSDPTTGLTAQIDKSELPT